MSDFFVGYQPHLPKGLARLMRRVVLGLIALAGILPVILIVAQHPFDPSVFEFHQFRDFEGDLEAKPYPTLVVRRPGVVTGASAYSRYLLVGGGKHGADDQVRPFVGKHVHLRGELIYRPNATMVELEPGSIRVLGISSTAQDQPMGLGDVTLTGEIVDTKCYFGVMKPGYGKVHRDCTARCLSGGLPRGFVVHGGGSGGDIYLLTRADGTALGREILSYVSEPVTIKGRADRLGDTLMLRANSIVRAPAF